MPDRMFNFLSITENCEIITIEKYAVSVLFNLFFFGCHKREMRTTDISIEIFQMHMVVIKLLRSIIVIISVPFVIDYIKITDVEIK